MEYIGLFIAILGLVGFAYGLLALLRGEPPVSEG